MSMTEATAREPTLLERIQQLEHENQAFAHRFERQELFIQRLERRLNRVLGDEPPEPETMGAGSGLVGMGRI